MSDLLKPKKITLQNMDGENERTYILSRIPAIPCREIISKYPLSALPKIGDYTANEEIMLKLMTYVAVEPKVGEPIRLTTQALIHNHVDDFETLAKIEWAMLEYNSSFLRAGKASAFLSGYFQKALSQIIETLNRSSGASSQPEKPLSTS